MEREEMMIKILKEDFGIETVKQLNEALSSLPQIDLSIFIKPLDERKAAV